jgi:hypothetical protein
MESRDDAMGPAPGEPENGKSREREKQDELLDRTAREEPFPEQLRSARDHDKGRPHPGKPQPRRGDS